MKGTYLGEFEEIVLMTVGILYDDAYGLAIMDEIERRTGRSTMISAVHKVLNRLEEKGFISSHMGGATEERGGRQKRLFTITAYGKKVLQENYEMRNEMYQAIPRMIWQLG
jgi:PadR family transcriptional regulator, regulatory protein PadR